MMFLQDPSLLEFQRRMQEAITRDNLKTILFAIYTTRWYGVSFENRFGFIGFWQDQPDFAKKHRHGRQDGQDIAVLN